MEAITKKISSNKIHIMMAWTILYSRMKCKIIIIILRWNDNIKQVQQMVEMEERDIKESERLGGTRKSQ